MKLNPIRRSQLIAPFGVGALHTLPDGTSVVTSGLDHWFETNTGGISDPDLSEFEIREERLEQRLGVSGFRLPPDYRELRLGATEGRNLYLNVPVLRFPGWHYCPTAFCREMIRFPLTTRGRQTCNTCRQKKNWKVRLIQVPFLATCDAGCLSDFPWKEWVHKDVAPACEGTLKLVSTGGATLAALKVQCSCGLERSLRGVLDAHQDGSTQLSRNLAPGGRFHCPGTLAWLGEHHHRPCDRPIRATLRTQLNLYFPDVRSAIYVPRTSDILVERAEHLLAHSTRLNTVISTLVNIGRQVTPADLRSGTESESLNEFEDDVLEKAISLVTHGPGETSDDPDADGETAFRTKEYLTFGQSREGEYLQVETADLADYSTPISEYFSQLSLVPSLRETRVLNGFSRVWSSRITDHAVRDQLMWRRRRHARWLPACIVYGEGIFFELDPEKTKEWEMRPSVAERATRLSAQYDQMRAMRGLPERLISARFILLHTLAHLLINELTFECGYSSASLRERLYVSSDGPTKMAAALIYTGAGDSEGTMGGLVRMGKASHLEPVMQNTLDNARWCSTDPVCMEMGDAGGQGPGSCNLAACHTCALVPETACEEFNMFLDRAMVIGSHGQPELGFFAP